MFLLVLLTFHLLQLLLLAIVLQKSSMKWVLNTLVAPGTTAALAILNDNVKKGGVMALLALVVLVVLSFL